MKFSVRFFSLSTIVFLAVLFCSTPSRIAAQDAQAPEAKKPDPLLVLTPEFGYKDNPSNMMRRYLQGRIDAKKTEWNKRYDTVKTEADAKKYQQERIDFFFSSLGPLPEKTPLNAKTMKTYQKDGYRVEMILLETMPKFYLTGALFLPDETKWQKPWPAMLVTCGHSESGKGYDVYQKTCALAALNGVAAFIIDPIDQGERHQYLRNDGRFYSGTTHAHNLCAIGSIPLGRNTATFMIWDMIRCVDYFQEREDLDSTRIGVSGNSGGGTQSAYLMALDPRVSVAAPACYLCSLYGDLIKRDNPQDAEQNIFGQLGFGMDHADYVMMRAPRATLMCTATKDFFPIRDAWEGFRHSKRFYDRFNASEYVSLIEVDEGHGWSKHLREATVRWMVRWFYDKNVEIVESENLAVLTKEESFVTEEREVLKIEGARSTYDFNRGYEMTLVPKRKEIWKDGLTDTLRDKIRTITGTRKLADIPEAGVEPKGNFAMTTPGGVEADVERFVATPEPGIVLPLLLWTPKKIENARPVVYLHGNGKTAGLARSADANDFKTIDDFLREGRVVVAVDLRGFGETQFKGNDYFDHKHFGPDGNTYCMGYLLGLSHVGMRTEDLLTLARWLKKQNEHGLDLYACGLPGTVALHAAALEPTLFDTVEVEASLISWSHLVETGLGNYPITELIHGALEVYDLPDLVESLGEKATFRKPVNAQNKAYGTPIVLPGR